MRQINPTHMHKKIDHKPGRTTSHYSLVKVAWIYELLPFFLHQSVIATLLTVQIWIDLFLSHILRIFFLTGQSQATESYKFAVCVYKIRYLMDFSATWVDLFSLSWFSHIYWDKEIFPLWLCLVGVLLIKHLKHYFTWNTNLRNMCKQNKILKNI